MRLVSFDSSRLDALNELRKNPCLSGRYFIADTLVGDPTHDQSSFKTIFSDCQSFEQDKDKKKSYSDWYTATK